MFYLFASERASQCFFSNLYVFVFPIFLCRTGDFRYDRRLADKLLFVYFDDAYLGTEIKTSFKF